MAAKGGGAVNGPDELDALAERLDLSELSRAQIEPLERRMGAEWSGTALLRNRRAQHVMRLREFGMGYAEVARACGLSDSRVRRIEQAYRSAQRAQEAERFARAQGQLPL